MPTARRARQTPFGAPGRIRRKSVLWAGSETAYRVAGYLRLPVPRATGRGAGPGGGLPPFLGGPCLTLSPIDRENRCREPARHLVCRVHDDDIVRA